MQPIINDINILSKGTFSKTDSSVLRIEGKIAAIGNLTITNGTNYIGNSFSNSQDYVAYSGNNISLSNGQSYWGNVKYNGTNSTVSSFNLNGYSVNKEYVFGTEKFLEYSDLSETLYYLANNTVEEANYTGVASVDKTLTLKIGNKSIYIINTSSTDFNNLVNLKLKNVYDKTLIVINVILTGNVTLNSFVIDKGTYSGNLIINFIDPTFKTTNTFRSLTILNSDNFSANIIATSCNISLTNSTINGIICVNSIASTGNNTINNSLFTKQSILPSIKLNPPIISSLDSVVNSNILVTLTKDGYQGGSIYYTLDGSDPTHDNSNPNTFEYVIPFNVSSIGDTEIKAMHWSSANIQSEYSYKFIEIICKTINPILVLSGANNNILSFTTDTGTSVKYTIDGSTIEDDSLILSYGETTLLENGFYQFRYQAYSNACLPSDILVKNVSIDIVEPVVTIAILDINDDIATPISSPGFDIPSGFEVYPDTNNGIKIRLTSNILSDIIYTEDGSIPTKTNGKIYTSEFITRSSVIRTVAYAKSTLAVSNLFEKKVIILNTRIIGSNDSYLRSLKVQDNLANNPNLLLDIGWIGPSIIVDDTVLYQNVVNILMTVKGERILNPNFGVTIHKKLFEIHSQEDVDEENILVDLKEELEFQETRILVDTKNSYARFNTSTNSLVVELSIINKFTKNRLIVKLGYSLDSIR